METGQIVSLAHLPPKSVYLRELTQNVTWRSHMRRMGRHGGRSQRLQVCGVIRPKWTCKVKARPWQALHFRARHIYFLLIVLLYRLLEDDLGCDCSSCTCGNEPNTCEKKDGCFGHSKSRTIPLNAKSMQCWHWITFFVWLRALGCTFWSDTHKLTCDTLETFYKCDCYKWVNALNTVVGTKVTFRAPSTSLHIQKAHAQILGLCQSWKKKMPT